MASKPLSKIRYTENPFVHEFSVSTRRKRVTVKGGKAIVDKETGEVENTAEICSVQWVDNDQFVKLFTRNLKVFFDLKPSTFKLLQVILHQVQQIPNNDFILLDMNIAEKYFTETGQAKVSKASFHRSINELIEKKFIALSPSQNMYFINPHLFFNGDRVKFAHEIRRRKGGKVSAAELEHQGQGKLFQF